MKTYTFDLLPPSVNTYWRRAGVHMHISKKGSQFKKDMVNLVKTQKPILSEKELSVKVELNFKHKRRRDIDNYCKGIFDSLSGILWIDDSQIVKLEIKKNIGCEKDNIVLVVE